MDENVPHAERITQAILDAATTYDWCGFERLVLLLLTADGSHGSLTPANGDNGIDVVVQSKDGLAVAQCKAYSQDSKVSAKEVREFLGAVVYTKAQRGYFFTTSSFTDQAMAFASTQPAIELIDRVALAKRLAAVLTQSFEFEYCAEAEKEGENSEVELLRRNACVAKDLAEHGRLDEALEVIYEIARQLELADHFGEKQDRLIHQQQRNANLIRRIEECDKKNANLIRRIEENDSRLTDLTTSLRDSLGPLALLETRREADYLKKHETELATAYADFSISVANVIEIMCNHMEQINTDGWWLINQKNEDSEWIPYRIKPGFPSSQDEYPSDSYIHMHRSGTSQWHWLIIDRDTHHPVAAFCEFTQRERAVRHARELVGDALLIEFFRAALHSGHPPVALKGVNHQLDAGRTLDYIFYTGTRMGYSLSATREGSNLHIELGCQADPTAGDGGYWVVTLGNNGHIATVKGGFAWIS